MKKLCKGQKPGKHAFVLHTLYLYKGYGPSGTWASYRQLLIENLALPAKIVGEVLGFLRYKPLSTFLKVWGPLNKLREKKTGILLTWLAYLYNNS